MYRCLQQALCVPVRALVTLQAVERTNKILVSMLNQIALEQPSSFRQSKGEYTYYYVYYWKLDIMMF